MIGQILEFKDKHDHQLSGTDPAKILTTAQFGPNDRIIDLLIVGPKSEERKILGLKI